MKRVKIMMTVISVLAVVGGALAFKARNFGELFCTRPIAAGPGLCAKTIYVGKVSQLQGDFYYTTPADGVAACTTVQCTRSTRLTSIE